MRKFGIVQSRFFVWARKRGLSKESRIVGAHMLICEHGNSLGCYRMPPEYVAADNGFTTEEVTKAYQELRDAGFLVYCEESEMVFFPQYLKWNPPNNGKHAKAILKIAESLPSAFGFGDMLVESLEKYCGAFIDKDALDTLSIRYGYGIDRVSDTVSDGYPKGIDTVSDGYPKGIDTVSDGYPKGIDTVSDGYRYKEKEREKEREREREKERERGSVRGREQTTARSKSPSPPPAPAQALMKIPLKTQNARGDPELHPITQADVDQWAKSYPTVDVPAELRALRQWNIDNPKKRKTKAGIGRHINAWLLRARDGPPQPKPIAVASQMSKLQQHNQQVEKAFLSDDDNPGPLSDTLAHNLVEGEAFLREGGVEPERIDVGATLREIAKEKSRVKP